MEQQLGRPLGSGFPQKAGLPHLSRGQGRRGREPAEAGTAFRGRGRRIPLTHPLPASSAPPPPTPQPPASQGKPSLTLPAGGAFAGASGAGAGATARRRKTGSEMGDAAPPLCSHTPFPRAGPTPGAPVPHGTDAGLPHLLCPSARERGQCPPCVYPAGTVPGPRPQAQFS